MSIAIDPTQVAGAEMLSKGAFDVDWRRIFRIGSICGLGLVFVALTGMPVGLDDRPIIDGVISLGYLSLIMYLPILGWVVGNETVLEGMAAAKRGARDIVAGAGVGAVGGFWMGLFTLLLDNFDLRDPLVNWNDELFILATFNRGAAFASWFWIIFGAILGGIGATLHVMNPKIRRAVMVMLLTVLGVSIFQSLVDDVLGGVGESIADPGRLSEFFGEGDTPRPRVDSVFDGLVDFLYAQRGGLTVVGAVALAVVSGAVSLSAVVGSKRQRPTMRPRPVLRAHGRQQP